MDMQDVFTVQDEITLAVVDALKLRQATCSRALRPSRLRIPASVDRLECRAGAVAGDGAG